MRGRMVYDATGHRLSAADRVDESDWDGLCEDPAEFDPDELREFLAADKMHVPVAPGFKERLRRKLWLAVKMRYGSRRRENI